MNRRVLIIDDDANLALLYKEFLTTESLGHQDQNLKAFDVTVAGHGQEGLEIVRQQMADDKPFAVAFVDMRMRPGWDGLTTAREIRKTDRRIYIVIITGFHDHSIDHIQDVLEHDVFYLAKPSCRDEIYQMARSLCLRWNKDHGQDFHETGAEANEDSGVKPVSPNTIIISGLTGPAKALLNYQDFVIRLFPFKIGRDNTGSLKQMLSDSYLFIEDTSPFNVSKNHLIINFYEDHYYVLDSGSHLGTIVNDELIGKKTSRYKAILKKGDNTLIIGGGSSPYQFKITV